MDFPCVPCIFERPFQLGEPDSRRVSAERVVATKTLKASCSVLVSSAVLRTGRRRCGLPLKPLMDPNLKIRIETEEYIYEEYFEA